MNKYIHAIGYGLLLSLIVFIGSNNIKTTKAADYYRLEVQKAKAECAEWKNKVIESTCLPKLDLEAKNG